MNINLENLIFFATKKSELGGLTRILTWLCGKVSSWYFLDFGCQGSNSNLIWKSPKTDLKIIFSLFDSYY
jgi:hypothetical protein